MTRPKKPCVWVVEINVAGRWEVFTFHQDEEEADRRVRVIGSNDYRVRKYVREGK